MCGFCMQHASASLLVGIHDCKKNHLEPLDIDSFQDSASEKDVMSELQNLSCTGAPDDVSTATSALATATSTCARTRFDVLLRFGRWLRDALRIWGDGSKKGVFQFLPFFRFLPRFSRFSYGFSFGLPRSKD